ncbi:MAG TPA: hypothetical protein VFB66_05925 [Tepidisphaeraceae bacterium]|nr:hypothetical protein [Tepidisphaeraceae bacterium]
MLNANHGTLCRLLLAGRPTLLVPLTLEQSVLTRRVCALGAAEVCPPAAGNGELAREKIERLATEGTYRAAAAEFARRHAFDRGELRREMLERVTALVGPGRRNEKSKSSLADPASCAGRTIVKT